MEFAMSGDMLKRVLGDDGKSCFGCGGTENLTTCKACKLTKCEECMANEDLCGDCIYQLETTGGFDTYTGYEFELEMYNKYIEN